MRLTKHFPLYMILLCLTLVISGCSSMFQEIQNWTGNRIEIVDDLTANSKEDLGRDQSSAKQKDADPEGLEFQSPKAHQKLDEILQDKGQGKYAGDKFDWKKFREALELMPKGLSEEKIYAYLLGLVGENYYREKALLDELAHTHYHNQLTYFQSNKRAQTDKNKQPKKPINMVILLNAGYSMADQMNGKRKLQIAKEEILKFSTDLPTDTSFSFRVYGRQSHEKKISCSQSEKISSSLKNNKQLPQAMKRIKPMGLSPLSTAIKNAYTDLKNMNQKQKDTQNMIFVISDRAESCGKDLIKTGKQVHATKVKAQIHTIGIDVNPKIEQDLKKVSDVTNGNFESVSTQNELQRVLKLHTEDIQRVNEPWQMKATDKMTRNYVSDKLRLRKNVEKITEKVTQEHQRLTEANQYIKAKDRINRADWSKIDDIIEKRKDQVKQYADDRMEQIDTKLNQEYKTQTQKIEKSWIDKGGKKEELDQRQNERLKILQETQNKNESQSETKQE